MKPFKSIKRAWARASILTVFPAAGFVCGLVLSAAFTLFYALLAHQDHVQQSYAYAQALQAEIAADVRLSDKLAVQTTLKTMAPEAAEVRLPNGQRFASTIAPERRRDAKQVPIMHAGEPVGTLLLAPLQPYQPLLSYQMAAAMCLIVSLMAALVMRVFARLTASYIGQVTEIVENFSLRDSARTLRTDLIFSEFRRLNVATIRTTRRQVREIKALRERAKYDPRTGLLNEFSLYKRIETAIETARYDAPAALIVIELNEFSRVTEEIGRTHSDQALNAITHTLKELLREAEAQRGLPTGTWSLATLQSEQFGILVQKFGVRDDLASLIREIQMAFRAPISIGSQQVSVSLSGSIVMIPEDGDSLTLIRQRADATIQDLKRQGKKGFSFYSPKLERQRAAHKKLEAELRQAVEDDRFVPLFQPKVELATGRICGAEALARWRLESGRLVSPSVFIDLAEQTGLISSIGEQIMRKACLETVQWNQLGHQLSIAVNVSPKQFERDGLSQMVLDSLARSGLSPRQLEIEITESLAIQHPERVRSVLKPLRKLGIKLAVDDFGTGHSNLATLTQLEFDVFKVDRQFVNGTPNDPSANAIVEMILSMANTLQMQIVGEGIETAPQADYLIKQSCHIGQGFLYSPPVTAQAFREMLEKQPFTTQRLIA